MERRFQPVFVGEPSVEDTVEILKGLRDKYEAHHRVKISDGALEAAAALSHRYISDRFLPDKAIDLIDEAASKLRMSIYQAPPELKELETKLRHLTKEGQEAVAARQYERAAELRDETDALQKEYEERKARWLKERGIDDIVGTEDVGQVVSSWTGIPVSTMLEAESEKLLKMEERLHQRVIGQDEAINAVSDAIRRSRSGLKDPDRPIGSFIFLGPTGVGKTELAKALAEFLFDSEEAMVRLDMSEYQERHTVSRLVGAPPGYVGYEEGGQLTEAVRRRPYKVILFDEVEKAHPDVFNILLQILEDGRLTDGHGRTVDFKNTVVIMTSNLGTEEFQRQSIGFSKQTKSERERQTTAIETALKQTFRPEFLNRIDEVVIFQALTEEQIKQIVDLMMKDVKKRLAERKITAELTEEAKSQLAKEGFDPAFGARPLRRTLQRQVENPLSTKILKGEFKEGDRIMVDVSPEGFTFTT